MEITRKGMDSKLITLAISLILSVVLGFLISSRPGFLENGFAFTIFIILGFGGVITFLSSGIKFSMRMLKVEIKTVRLFSILIYIYLIVFLVLWIMESLGNVIFYLGLNYFMAFLIGLGIFLIYNLIVYFADVRKKLS